MSPETFLARKQSLNQLNQNSASSSKDSGYGGDSDGGLEIGDSVNVPGGMYGTVKFVGVVKGKPGVFVGVELEGPHAVNGKNDGTVEGTRYFTTSVPHSGIFLPLNRATLRNSGSSVRSDPPSLVTSPAEPTASSPLQPPKRPFGRPSLPRPQSPAQRNITPRPGLMPTTPGRPGSSLSNRMFSPSPTPGMGRNRGLSTSSNSGDAPGGNRRPQPPQSQTPRGLRPGFNSNKPHPSMPHHHQLPPTPRAGSSLSFIETSPTDDDDNRSTPKANGHNSAGSLNGGGGSGGFNAKMTRMSREDNMMKEAEDKGMIAILQAQLSAKDHQLKEQANNLLEMEGSLNELQMLLSEGVAAAENAERQQPAPHSNQQGLGSGNGLGKGNSSTSVGSGEGEEELEMAQLRHMLREKSEKIVQLQLDFDAHRADFRSTIDTLEMAATETERVYEKKVEDLLGELREVERMREELVEDRVRREEMGGGNTPVGGNGVDGGVEGVEGVARQLKSLEGLVAELEEGLEDARRGEAEARAEAEHCRGEMDDLKQSVKIGENEVEKKNDEIRGLKAIMTSLSRGKPAIANGVNAGNLEEEKAARRKLEERVKDLEGLLDKKNLREEELEQEVERAKAANSGLKITLPLRGDEQKSLAVTKDTAPRPVRTSSLRKLHDSPALTDIDDEDEDILLNGMSISAPPPPPPKKDTPPITPAATVTTTPAVSQAYCDLCEKPGHDILSCTEMFSGKSGANKKDSVATFTTLEKAGMTPLPLNTSGVVGRSSLEAEDETRGGVSLGRATTPSGNSTGNGGGFNKDSLVSPIAPGKDDDEDDPDGLPAVAGKSSGVVDRTKWCALCERDGHDSVDCPLDDF
ncbi:hypothetical protein ABW20_dc0101310 [Dactylellina cionopaga]|nr:hypothetical protein ABW20_dc0101310 [Dactylellina cionopaga]